MKRYRHVISKEHHPSWERGQRYHTSPRCPLSSFTSFSDSCDVAGRSLSKLLPARDVVEEVEFLILRRQGSLSRLIDASYSVHLRLLRNQRYKPPSNPPKCRVISRLGIFTVRGPLLSPGVTSPSVWLEHEGPSGHPRLSGTIVPIFGASDRDIEHQPFYFTWGSDMFNGWSHSQLLGRYTH